MTGQSFFAAAADAIGLIIRNPVRFAIVGGLGEVFVAIGRLFIAAGTAVMCYLIVTKDPTYSTTV